VVWFGGGWRSVVWTVAALGAVYAVVALSVLRTRTGRDVRRPPAGAGDADDGGAAGRSLVRRAVGALAGVVTAPAMLALAVLAFAASAASWGVRAYAVVLLTDGYGFAEGPANLVATAMFVVGAGLILAGGVLSDRVGAGPVLLGGFAGLAALAAGLATGALPLLVAAAATVLLYGGVTVSRPARSKLTDALAGQGDVGKSFALVTVGISLGGAVAPPAFGWVVERTTVGVAFAGVSAVAVAAALLTVAVLRLGEEASMGSPTAAD